MLDLQRELHDVKLSSQAEIDSCKEEIKQYQEEKSLIEQELRDLKKSCDSLEEENKNLEKSVQNCKKIEVSRPESVFIEQTEQIYNIMYV